MRRLASVFLVLSSVLAGCGGSGGDSGRNGAPIITATTLVFQEDAPPEVRTLDVRDRERDSFELSYVTPTAHGRLDGPGSGAEIIYTPDANYSGPDSFVVRAVDSRGAMSADVTIPIKVIAVNDPPSAISDRITFSEGTAPYDVTANDVDVDGDVLSVAVLTQPEVGAVTVIGNRIVYQPSGNFAGPVRFNYRVTDAAGATSDAEVRLMVGGFPGVLIQGGPFPSAEPDLLTFDGFDVQQWNENYGTGDFAVAGDGRHASYVSRASQSDRGSIYVLDAAQPVQRPGNPRRVFGRGFNVQGDLQLALSPTGSYLLVSDPQGAPGPVVTNNFVVDLASGSASPIASPANVFPLQPAIINPVSDEFYLVAAVSSATPPLPTASTYNTVYAGDTVNLTLSRIGATYAVGEGSGVNLRVTPNGRYVLHAAETGNPTVANLLVNDRVTNTETPLYRAFSSGEFPAPLEFDVNNDGSKVCFRLNAPGSDAVGPGRFWVADPAAPGSAAAVTSTADYNFDCRWTSNGHSFAYLSANGNAAPEAWLVDTQQPNVVQRLREPLSGGQTTEFFAIARGAPTGVVGVTEPVTFATSFHRVGLDVPGTSTQFRSAGVIGSRPNFRLDSQGDWLGYIKTEARAAGGTVRRLHLASTRIPDHEIVVTLPLDGAVEDFAFLRH